ncbi:MAG: MaoC family dehydratase N-terminal domain-containing protein [Chloroflexi bacterium]|nr:MaoC family dehydratase N-terminal domain-containing protein [Chloroflexota bacterium]
MAESPRIAFAQLVIGYELPPNRFTLDGATVLTYLRAVEDESSLYQDSLVPPMAVAARAMAALGEGMSLPAGAIHVSQEFEFLGTVKVGENLTSYAKVSRKVDRGKIHMLTIDLDVCKAERQSVVTGKTGFILP